MLNAGLPLDRAEADLAPVGVELLLELGLAEESAGELVPRLRLVPNGELVIASDLGSYVQPDHAASVHRPSVTLASLTVRKRVARALDVGTGTGVPGAARLRRIASVSSPPTSTSARSRSPSSTRR